MYYVFTVVEFELPEEQKRSAFFPLNMLEGFRFSFIHDAAFIDLT